MAKFEKFPSITENKKQELLIFLCKAFASIRNPKEAAQFLADLLSPPEIEMIAKRLQIAHLLVSGLSYEEIRIELRVGFSTIAKVNTWLNLQGDGFKIMIKRANKSAYKPPTEEDLNYQYSWHNIKRRHTKYFLPQLLIEELLKNSDKKQRKNIITVLQSMVVKKNIAKKIDMEYLEKFN